MSDNLEKFTERARHVLTLAQEESLRFKHDYIGTEHILLGLVRDGDGIAARALGNVGVELEAARQEVERIVGLGNRPSGVITEIPLTPRAKNVVELSFEEARRLGNDYIGTEHLILGLLREREGVAASVLDRLGIPLERAKAEAMRVRGLADVWTKVSTPATIIDGKAIAEEVRAEATARAKALHERGVTPGLALVLVGDNPSSLSYVRSKGDAAEQAGLFSDMYQFPDSIDQQSLISRILDLNDDSRFHGILVQLPLPKQLDEDVVIGAIDPSKDADGVTPINLGRLMRGEPCPWPATPAGVVELLHRSGHSPAGKHVVICGRSNIVGKPLAAILSQKSERANATVSICHTGTPDLPEITRQADILIAAMGAPLAIKAHMVKPGAVVIDVGNNWISDPLRTSGRRLVGDVDFEGVRNVASAITPVPGGVGPMTVAMLIANTVWLAERQTSA